ncbi:BRO-N domain-containing protein [Sneathia vaginalis]|jgi:prophage antirepressor-like protein|uniref:BRO-N domain-containing protein n=1 Tax=Sneathia vaginalis TaxID=187101 RepID=UPI0006987C60|nr:BRO family protein [Sneathia vaginalis]DAM85294.1 MAG TPA: hypothetical protein [Caudoviricetes sp.]
MKMGKIMETFKFENKEVRIKILDNEIWFVAADITDILGYDFPSKAIRNHVDDEDKILDQKIDLINESGLYNLIFASKLVIAMKFKKWIISEVLSKFRNYGNEETYKQTQIDGLISEYYAHYVEYLKKDIDEKNKLINESYEIIKGIKNTY